MCALVVVSVLVSILPTNSQRILWRLPFMKDLDEHTLPSNTLPSNTLHSNTLHSWRKMHDKMVSHQMESHEVSSKLVDVHQRESYGRKPTIQQLMYFPGMVSVDFLILEMDIHDAGPIEFGPRTSKSREIISELKGLFPHLKILINLPCRYLARETIINSISIGIATYDINGVNILVDGVIGNDSKIIQRMINLRSDLDESELMMTLSSIGATFNDNEKVWKSLNSTTFNFITISGADGDTDINDWLEWIDNDLININLTKEQLVNFQSTAATIRRIKERGLKGVALNPQEDDFRGHLGRGRYSFLALIDSLLDVD